MVIGAGEGKLKTYYQIQIYYDKSSLYLIWVSFDDKEMLLANDSKLILFSSLTELEKYGKKNNIIFEEEKTVYDLDEINNIKKEVVCENILDIWNLFTDIAKVGSEKYLGDEDGVIEDLYDKLFLGSNLPVLKQKEEYKPIWNKHEINLLSKVLKSGLIIFECYLP